jgi:hypothetical protein
VPVHHRGLAAQEIEQVWHLLQFGWHVGHIPSQMHVVELEVDDVLDGRARRLQRARAAAGSHRRRDRESYRSKRKGSTVSVMHFSESSFGLQILDDVADKPPRRRP